MRRTSWDKGAQRARIVKETRGVIFRDETPRPSSQNGSRCWADKVLKQQSERAGRVGFEQSFQTLVRALSDL